MTSELTEQVNFHLSGAGSFAECMFLDSAAGMQDLSPRKRPVVDSAIWHVFKCHAVWGLVSPDRSMLWDYEATSRRIGWRVHSTGTPAAAKLALAMETNE